LTTSEINFENDVYALFLVPIFRSSVKEEQRNPRKIFIVDNGFNYIYNTSFSNEYSKLYENLVFLYLRRTYKEIYYFKENQEVDFFVPESRILINVSFKIDSQKTFDREISALNEVMEKYKVNKCFLITSNEEKESDNIKIIPLWKFLLSDLFV